MLRKPSMGGHDPAEVTAVTLKKGEQKVRKLGAVTA